MPSNLELPLIDLSSPDRASTAKSIRKACIEYGFFYLVNHGVEQTAVQKLFAESKKFFALPLHERMKLERNSAHRGYTPMYSETLDLSSELKGDLKESFYIGPEESGDQEDSVNQWPLEENLPCWRATMTSYYKDVLMVAKRVISLMALALDLDDEFFERIGALRPPMAFVRLLHYPGELMASDYSRYGASAHSDYGMITLLITDGVPGLQICKEKDKHPRLWEDVHHVDGAFIVNVGDLLERWTNCLFRSTLHRVIAVGQERYSDFVALLLDILLNRDTVTSCWPGLSDRTVAFFLDPNPDCLVECLESCCNEASPARFPPIRSGDYLQERLRVTYA